MKRMAAVFLSVFFILFASNPMALAKEWDPKSTDDINKVWKVYFTVPLDRNSLTADSIYVLDGQKKHAVTLRLTEADKVVEVIPSVSYTIGKSYRLMVTTAIKSKQGIALQIPVEIPFQVVDTTDDIGDKIRSIQVTTSGILTNVTVAVNADVHRVTINGEDMHYMGNNTYNYTLIDVKPGSTLTVNGYDENNKQIESKRYTISQ